MDRQRDQTIPHFESNSVSQQKTDGSQTKPTHEQTSRTSGGAFSIVVASTFSADSLVIPLKFWMETLAISADIAMAPYAQVMQGLLDRQSLLSRNASGFNILLIRPQDWIRDRISAESLERNLEHIRTVTGDFVAAMEGLRARTSSPMLVFLCPSSSSLAVAYRQPLEESQSYLRARLGALVNVHCWTHADLVRLYPVTAYEDTHADRIGHIPYTDEYSVAIATLLARRIAALTEPQHKVIAIDCDNTLWKGVCGEDGAAGVELTPAHLTFQQMLVRQHDAGVLLCLCSKNNVSDVGAVFKNRQEMPLREELLTSSRVNWHSKSSNLQSLSEELELSLDSFIFIDDNPAECAEVQAHCPSVLTLRFPQTPEEVAHFIDHVWAFDRIGVTEEAKRRTAQYKENRTRKIAIEQAADLDGFLASLELKVDLSYMQSSQLSRVAELIQRTNQFNMTTIRRRPSEIETLWKSGEFQILVVHVQDRFGDYGLVGALFLRREPSSIDVETFVLSCRALGRGVEQRIVSELGSIARREGLKEIVLRYRQTQRNAPAWEFLERSFMQFRAPLRGNGEAVTETVFAIPFKYAERAAGAQPSAEKHTGEKLELTPSSKTAQSGVPARWHEEAYRLSHPSDIVREINRSYPRAERARGEYQAPRTPTEAAIAGIWAEVLGLEEVGTHDDFFELGGDSLQAVRAIARIASVLGLELTFDQFFEGSTVARIAANLISASQAGLAIQRVDRADRVPLSWAQQRLWFIDQLDGGSASYNHPLAIRMSGALNRAALQAALDTLIGRHEPLRARFIKVDGVPCQAIAPVARFALQLFDVRALEENQRDTILDGHVREESTALFDLSSGPPIRGRLIGLSEEEHVLLITMHHIVSDGWSVGVLFRELAVLYGAYSSGRPDPLPPLPIQYADYVQWQREQTMGAELQKQLAYWKAHLQGSSQFLQLPTDRPRPAIQSYRGASASVSLGSELTADLKAFSRRFNLTLAMTLCTAWSIVLSTLSGQEDIVVGMPVANRRRIELEGLIGLFVNTVAMRVRLEGDPLLADLLQQVKDSMLGAYAHQDVPFEQVVEALKPARSLSRSPIFQVMFVMQNAPRATMELPGLRLEEQEVPAQTAQFDLLLSLQESSDEIVGTLNYASDLFDCTTAERWVRCLKAVLRGMVRDSQRKISRLPMMSEEERRQVIDQFNAPRITYPSERLIHETFEEQVRLTPEAVAVMCEEQRLTYAELNGRANQLANCLRKRGVGPDQLVALCVERSLETVVGLLGILKAGGAYVPLDPNYPVGRLRYMLKDAAPRVLLTQGRLRGRFSNAAAEVVALDADWNEIAENSAENLEIQNTGPRSHLLAYVIYTSGSMGEPKGVMVEHGNVIRLFSATQSSFNFNRLDVWTLFHSFSFDFSVWELWGALLYGGRVVVVPHLTARSPQSFYRLLCDEGVTVLNQTPSAFAQLIDAQAHSAERKHSLRAVIFGGEALELRTLRPWTERHGSTRPELVNMYGITETTVHVTHRRLSEEDIASERDSLVGKPIPDLRVYLLDRRGQPVPIGVTGEIYVGGAGLARGYLNRPELTAERFIADPFSADPQARLYKTGDLGRRRLDGAIEYLGRNDQQVKIRGFRIELGEIEAQLARHVYVKDAVVVVREDAFEDKRLVAYVIPRNLSCEEMTENVQALRTHLKSVLPEHMLPSAFVFLGSFPLTANGKLDRRALPAPNLGAHVSQKYEVPLGKVEETVARIWQELLGIDRVGREDNFFELGGHSLLALKLLYGITQCFGYTLSVADVYRNPTLRELSIRVCGSVTADDFVDLSREATLNDEIQAKPGVHRVPAQTTLLTGCTGFVGRFLLAQLLQETDATVYCLVRARSQQQAADRLKTSLLKWGLWRDEMEGRVVVIAGDLNIPRLGLDEVAYERLSAEVDSIYHCGTSMNHLETYAMAKATNVEAARELLKLATHRRPKLINYISTLSVFSSSAINRTRVVGENSPIDREAHRSSAGYAASKWVGEKIFMTAAERGIRCNIFRLGLVWADTQQGRYDELQRGYRIFKSCLLLGRGIQNYGFEMAPTPVDYVARAVVYLANRYGEGRGIFHISSSDQMVGNVFERCNEIANVSLELVSFYEWIQEVKRAHQGGWSLPAVPLVEFAFSMDAASFHEHQRAVGSSGIRFDCTQTHRELECAGIVTTSLDDDLLRVFLQGMLSRDAELREWSTAMRARSSSPAVLTIDPVKTNDSLRAQG